jgi:precorrin-4/cobalt-precorrin-4 C11-methyltransferase
VAELVAAHERGQDVARLHSGDLSVWSALGEQLRRLSHLGVPYTITPGVPAFSAAAAALGKELTLPELAQTVVLTRTPGRASALPAGESLEHFAASGATLAIHLSVHVITEVVARLSPYYGTSCPAAVVFRASWPDEKILRGTLADIASQVRQAGIGHTALILVGPVLDSADFRESALYSQSYQRRFRGRR